MKTFLLTLVLLICNLSFSQTKKVLIYHETNGFRHGSINNGITMIESQGATNGLWTTDNSQDSNVFTAANLAQYDVVIFLNTSGNDESGSDGDLLLDSEKVAFENFIINGGAFVGVHAATDNCRDGNWPFYNELVGGIVQTNPNHTSNGFNATMDVLNNHPAVDFLGDSWNKNEEYYYWELNGGQLSADNTVLLEVESTESNSYDAARPMSWYKESITVEGATFNNIKSFYTALGHSGGDYDNDSNFQTHIEEAIKWAINEETLSILETFTNEFKVFPNPFEDRLSLQFDPTPTVTNIEIHSITGKLVYKELVSSLYVSIEHAVDLSTLQSGVYLFSLKKKDATEILKIVKL